MEQHTEQACAAKLIGSIFSIACQTITNCGFMLYSVFFFLLYFMWSKWSILYTFHVYHCVAMKMLMRTMKFHVNKSIDWSIDRNILFSRNEIHAMHLAAFIKTCVWVCVFCCSYFAVCCLSHVKMFHIFIVTTFLCSFANRVVAAVAVFFPIFILNIPLRLLMSLDICTYYCGVINMLLHYA